MVTEPRVLGPLEVSFGQVKNNPNPPQDFAHLWSELQRVAGQCAIDAPVREVRIDVMNADVESIVWIIQQAYGLANTPQGLGDRVQAEIQTWATSPTPTAWSAQFLRQTVYVTRSSKSYHPQIRRKFRSDRQPLCGQRRSVRARR